MIDKKIKSSAMVALPKYWPVLRDYAPTVLFTEFSNLGPTGGYHLEANAMSETKILSWRISVDGDLRPLYMTLQTLTRNVPGGDNVAGYEWNSHDFAERTGQAVFRVPFERMLEYWEIWMETMFYHED